MSVPAAAQPQLARPGAGLPWFEWFMSRYVLLPLYYRKTSWEKAQATFERQGEKIVALCRDETPERLGTRVLVERLPGIEDSSRYWSAAMTMEHLVIVGELMRTLIVALSRGETPDATADVAKVKPPGTLPPGEAVERFAAFQARFSAAMMEEVRDRFSPTRFSHPWFGMMTARQWHALAGLHERVHRQQIERILAGLGSRS